MIDNSFEKLRVWQSSYRLTLEIYKITKSFPSDEKFGLVAQIRRSSTSVCANISEGYKKSKKDFRRYLTIAQGSLEETKCHLLLSKDLDYFTISKYEELANISNDTGKMLSGLIRKLA